MKRHSVLLAIVALLSASFCAHAQNAPTPKGKAEERKRSGKHTAEVISKQASYNDHYATKDTAAFNRKFRRFSRPATFPVPIPVRKVK
ncbi:hypothetical protein MON38_20945 [Hymenobacter sp. DH14]|jgi:hypothetical protein|uniref:Uncharacterized protein n=1 Tax=Hymenobacter cyanobacteriorum TaxID=2926463 RepID=A0A9X1VJP4_9BACT|nr:hypothetical protein [Hymenobacter cyanobacteriorum]MCI1189898.1 hypothetical protein [Hymenobacter cyanobacteriorum]